MNTMNARRRTDTEVLPANWRARRSSLPCHAIMAGSRCENASPIAVTTPITVVL